MEDEIIIPDLSLMASKASSEIKRFYAEHYGPTPDLSAFKQIEYAGKGYLNQLFFQALKNPVTAVDKLGVFAKAEISIDKETDVRLLAHQLSDKYFGFWFSMLQVQSTVTPYKTSIVIYFS